MDSVKIGLVPEGFRVEHMSFERAPDKFAATRFEFCEPALTFGRGTLQVYWFNPRCAFDGVRAVARRTIESRGLQAPALSVHTNLMGPHERR